MDDFSVQKVANSLASLFIDCYSCGKSKPVVDNTLKQYSTNEMDICLYLLSDHQRKVFLDNFDIITEITENILKNELKIKEFYSWTLFKSVVTVYW